MFRLLRYALVIGTIFYLSPVRQGPERPSGLDGRHGSALPQDPGEALRTLGQLGAAGAKVDLKQLQQVQQTWNDLSPGAKDMLSRLVAGQPEPAPAASATGPAPPPRPPRERGR